METMAINDVRQDLYEKTAEQIKTNHICPITKGTPLPTRKECEAKNGDVITWPNFTYFNEALDFALNLRKKSAADVSRHVSGSHHWLYDVRGGKSKPTYKQLKVMEELLKTPNDFLCGKKYGRPKTEIEEAVSEPIVLTAEPPAVNTFKVEISGIYNMDQLRTMLALIAPEKAFKCRLSIEA